MALCHSLGETCRNRFISRHLLFDSVPHAFRLHPCERTKVSAASHAARKSRSFQLSFQRRRERFSVVSWRHGRGLGRSGRENIAVSRAGTKFHCGCARNGRHGLARNDGGMVPARSISQSTSLWTGQRPSRRRQTRNGDADARTFKPRATAGGGIARHLGRHSRL